MSSPLKKPGNIRLAPCCLTSSFNQRELGRILLNLRAFYMSEKFISLHLLTQNKKNTITYAFVHLEMLKLVSCRSEPKFLSLRMTNHRGACLGAEPQMGPSQHCKSGPQRVLFSLKQRVLVYQMVPESGIKTCP